MWHKPTSEWKMLNSTTSSITTPKCGNKRHWRWSNHSCWPLTVVDIRCRLTGRESIPQITSTRHWILLRRLDDISHHNIRPKRNNERDIFEVCVVVVQQYAASSRNGRQRTTSPIIGHRNRNPTKIADHFGLGADEGNTLRKYTVDHIVERIRKNQQQEYVV